MSIAAAIRRILGKILKYFDDDSSPSSISASSSMHLQRPVTLIFGRSLWAEDNFYPDNDDYKVQDQKYAQDIESMKQKVRNMIADTETCTPRDKMAFIDTIERLGIAYHFEKEIEEQIEQIFKDHDRLSQDDDSVDDLFTTALYFRMFRQHGFDVSCSVFDKFKDDNDTFKKELCGDVEGLLSLYEASFLRFREESVLQEAREFASHRLKEAKIHLENCPPSSSSSYGKDKANRSDLILLQRPPLHWALRKVEARYYISIYEKKESKDETLILRLSKLDFHVMQRMYRKEMHELQKWWYGFDLLSKLPYARDCVVPSYFWASALSYEPKYSRSRIAAAKICAIGTLFNDTYDNYATLEEAEALTDIMQRMDTTNIDKLPKYMKIVYDVLLHAFDEFEHEASERGRSYAVAYSKEMCRQAASAYYKKAKWYKGKERPRFRDHVDSMGITSGLHQMLAAFYMHAESASKDTFDWLVSKPSSVELAALHCRYLNDVSSFDRERETGHYPTSVDCYMEENGVSIQEAKEKFAEFAESCLMSLNKEWIETTTTRLVPKDILKPVFNFCRAAFANHGHGLDLFSHPEKGLVASINTLLLDPIIM